MLRLRIPDSGNWLEEHPASNLNFSELLETPAFSGISRHRSDFRQNCPLINRRGRESEEAIPALPAISSLPTFISFPLRVLCASVVYPAPFVTSGTFSAAFVPLDIRQEAGKQAEHGKKSADVEYVFDTRMISKPAKDR
jgi:hypothetical protein